MSYIKGNYKKNIFESNNGYIIGLFKITETDDLNIKELEYDTITFTGYFADLNMNDSYTFFGELIDHPKYGFQYQVDKYEKIKPNDKDSLVEFLSSELFNGIGVKLATKIVNELGDKTVDLILEDKNNLYKVPKISSKKVDIIYDTLVKYSESEKIIIYLTELGFNMKDSLKIYNMYKENTILEIENNIYKLIDDLNINFKKIDEIYIKNNSIDSKIRIKYTIIYIMNELIFKNSDIYLYYDEIKKDVLNYLKFNITDDDFNNYIDELRFEGKIVLENNNYYLKNMYDDELYIVNRIKLLNDSIPSKLELDSYIEDLESDNEITYSEKQKEAIKKALENNILIITGGPGTGKTTIIKAIVDLYLRVNNYSFKEGISHIALLAPTGRASKRMSEACLFPSSTIHRYLKWNNDTDTFNVNEYNKNNEELIIVDEVSMIDNNLLASLFKGIKTGSKVILVGDYDQLPSVGPGEILKDLIESEVIDTIKLDLLYRRSDESYISNLALNIKNDLIEEDMFSKKDDYVFLECNESKIKDSIINIAKKLKEKEMTNFQFLAPMYAGVNGIDNLNKELQNIFNPKSDNYEIKYGDVIFRENDKILELVNITEENVFNGDIGYIKYIIPFYESDSGKNEIYVDYDGNIVKYLPQDFIKIKHGYAISIHKSQGSEFDTVVMPICHSYRRMLYKKLIYTGTTRAKSKV